MKKLFEKNETLFCILLIILYVVINSVCLQNFGMTDIRTAIFNTGFSILLSVLMLVLKRTKYYGLTSVQNPKKYLFFIPLIILATINLWNGISIQNPTDEIIFHIINMINVGFIEEIIFRGFLFKMMEKSSIKSAIIVSAITFGIGHIVNLLNGADLIPTLLQICSATAIGYLFVIIFYKSKSLVPCIITHAVINSTSILGVENEFLSYITTLVVIVVSVVYAVCINRSVRG